MFGAEMMINALMSAAGVTPEAVQAHIQTAVQFMAVQDARLTRMEATLTRLENFLASNALDRGPPQTVLLQSELPPTIEGTSNAE